MRKKLIIPALAALLLWSSCTADISNAELRAGYPPIYPDYCGVTVPCNIAPMHFQMSDNAIQVRVMAEGADGKSIRVKAREVVTFRISEWKDLLASSTGSGLQVTVQAKYRDKGWVRYDPFTIYVSPVPMNDFLVYRLIAPGYEVYSKMGIYQRDLGSFLQTPLLENTLIPGNCMNCHSFYGNNPDKMSIHIRGELGGTILKAGDKIEMLNTKTEETGGNCVYPYWHPSGEYVVYSVNQTIQAFHAIRERRIEVIDLASDIVVYHPQSKQLLTNDLLRTDAFETFPSFSPDGRTLYFSSSQSQNIPEGYDKIRMTCCHRLRSPDRNVR